MEMASKRVRCSYCGTNIVVPPYTHVVQCAVCQTIIRIHPNDPLSQAHNSICCAARRFRDMLNTASSNINTVVNNYTGSGTSGFGYHPQQARPSPSVIPVSAHGRKRAVLCGVSYYGQRYRLNGTVNDVKCMRFFLIQKVGFPSDSILVLTGKSFIVFCFPSVQTKFSTNTSPTSPKSTVKQLLSNSTQVEVNTSFKSNSLRK